MSFKARIFFKNHPIEHPVSVSGIFNIRVDGEKVEPKNLKFENSKTISLDLNVLVPKEPSRSLSSVFVIKSADVSAVQIISEN